MSVTPSPPAHFMSRVPRTALNIRSFPGFLLVSVILPHVCDQDTFRKTRLNMNSILVFFTYLGPIPKGYLQSSFWICIFVCLLWGRAQGVTITGKLTSSKVCTEKAKNLERILSLHFTSSFSKYILNIQAFWDGDFSFFLS